MFKNYLKIAVRNFYKHKVYSIINISGLTIGITCSLLILLYVLDETSYDKQHSKAGRTYRLSMTTPQDSTRGMGYPVIGGGIALRLQTDFPDIETTVRIFKQGQTTFVQKNTRFMEENIVFADSTFFDVFDFPLLSGNGRLALQTPYSLIVTRNTAIKYFGELDIVGRSIDIEAFGQTIPLKITGVLENISPNSHFHFDHLISLNTFNAQFNNPGFLTATIGNAYFTYFTLPEGYDASIISSQLPAFVERHHPPQERTFVASYFIQPLTDIHLNSHLLAEFEQNGSATTVNILTIVAFMTIIIACINFMNLATARSTSRAREVGVRKVVGAYRFHLFRQFMGESFVYVIASLVLSLGLTWASLPVLNGLWEKSLSLSVLTTPEILLGITGMIILVGFLSGSYPSLLLSSFKPVEVLKGTTNPGSGNIFVRKALVIFQFVISIGFIAGTGVIFYQINFIKTRDVGFDRFNRINTVLDIPAATPGGFFNTVELLKQEFLRLPGVEAVTVTSGVPTQLRGITVVKQPGALPNEEMQIASVIADYDYIPTLGINLIGGRNFSAEMGTDSTEAIILNETAVEGLQLENPVGAAVEWRNSIVANPNSQVRNVTVIGVIQDLHFEPLHRRIAPMMLVLSPNFGGGIGIPGNMLVKVNSASVSRTLQEMESKWSELVPQRTFRYTFLDDDFNEQYKNEDKLSENLSYFTFIVIFIACLGLFGLASFTAEQRTKEIGIRKVLGASVKSIIWNLSKEYTKLIAVAFALAIPFTWYFSSRWLENFFYSFNLGSIFPLIFLLTGLITLLITFLTVSYQTVKASLANPIDSLRYE